MAGYCNAMSQGNLEILREGYLALNRGDVEALIALADPNVEYDMSRRTFDAAVYHGHDGVRKGLSLIADQWETLRFEPQDFIVAGDDVVVPVRLVGVGKQSGVETTANAAHVWSFRNRKIVRQATFQTLGEALEAVGLRE
jgi:ketosteroid isomerase-like protein